MNEQTDKKQNPQTQDWTLQPEDHDQHDDYVPGAADLAVVGLSLAVLLVCLVLSVRYLFFPGESDEDHIKRRILRDGGQP